jgi:SagB-type dehydrogenase domain
VYRYRPEDHELVVTDSVDRRAALADAALDQAWVEEGAVVLIIAAVYSRTTQKYGGRGRRYVHMEVGTAAQNVYLQATALDLGTVFVGAFEDRSVKEVLGLPDAHHPLGMMPVGHVNP